jgi:hypothetical protein
MGRKGGGVVARGLGRVRADDGVRRRAWHNVGLAALVLLGCATAGPYRLTERLPAELPDAATIAGWERYAGQARIGESAVVYELYVNPVRPALYEITRYRLTSTALDTDGRRRSHEETEKVLWNPATVPRQPLRCFEWVTQKSWKKLWLGASGEWRRIEPSTAAYKSEMETAIKVYNLHNQQQVY